MDKETFNLSEATDKALFILDWASEDYNKMKITGNDSIKERALRAAIYTERLPDGDEAWLATYAHAILVIFGLTSAL